MEQTPGCLVVQAFDLGLVLFLSWLLIWFVFDFLASCLQAMGLVPACAHRSRLMTNVSLLLAARRMVWSNGQELSGSSQNAGSKTAAALGF